MGLWEQITRRFDTECALSKLADQIASRCFDVVWQRVQGQLLGLAPAEARGYIRARGSRAVQSQVQVTADRDGLSRTQRTRLYTLTLNAVVQRVQSHARALETGLTRRAA